MIKDVPYFQLFAANFLAKREYKLMGIDERGLFISIYMECWVNRSVPADPEELAKYLGFTCDQIKNGLTKRVMSFLIKADGNLIAPELEGYREDFYERRKKQSAGGKDGARKKKEKNLGNTEEVQGTPGGQPKGSLIHIKSNSFNSNQLIKEEVMSKENKAWLDDYEKTSDTFNDYLKASGG